MRNYINIDRITAETHEQFDTFAANVTNDTMQEMSTPSRVLGKCVDNKCRQALNTWVQAGLIDINVDKPCSMLDIAMVTILTVLKKRGLSMTALQQIRDALNLPMYNNMSVLGFVVLLCRQCHMQGLDVRNAPFLVIDGENRITLCRAVDAEFLVIQPEISTYSQIFVNLYRVLHECDFIYKIRLSHMSELMELPVQIAAKLYDSKTKRFTVNIEKTRLQTVLNGGEDPEYGERTIKYADGKVVSDILTVTEVLDV